MLYWVCICLYPIASTRCTPFSVHSWSGLVKASECRIFPLVDFLDSVVLLPLHHVILLRTHLRTNFDTTHMLLAEACKRLTQLTLMQSC